MTCTQTQHKHLKTLWNQRYLSEFHKCHLQDAITYSFHGIWVDELWKRGLFTRPIYTLFDFSKYSSTSRLILSQAPSQRMKKGRAGHCGKNANKLQSLSKLLGTFFKIYIFQIFHWFYWFVPFCIFCCEITLICKDFTYGVENLHVKNLQICALLVRLNLEILISSDFLKNKIWLIENTWVAKFNVLFS